MKLIELKAIVESDFRLSVRTLYDALRRDRKRWRGDPQPGEAYCLVSASGRQLAFVLADTEVTIRRGTRHERTDRLLDVRLWRIESGAFDPSMLEDYARAVGLTLGRATFAERWESRRQR